MKSTPESNARQLALAEHFKTLAAAKEKELKELTDLAAAICTAPMACITFVERDTLHFRNEHTLQLQSAERKDTFSDYVLRQKGVLMVCDTWKDERFKDNPFVKGYPHIRFYAGTPLITQSGESVGSLCVLASEVMVLNISQQQTLKVLAQQVIHLLEADPDVLLLQRKYL